MIPMLMVALVPARAAAPLGATPAFTLPFAGYGGGGMKWGDLDADGDPDLLLSQGLYVTLELLVYENTGGALTLLDTVALPPDETSFGFADIDGDGDSEIVVDSSCGYASDRSLILYDLQGVGVTPIFEHVGCQYTTDLATGDLDGDGLDDIAVVASADSSWGTVGPAESWLATGTALVRAWESAERDFSWAVDLGDVDGDGDLDLAVANGGSWSWNSASGAPNRVYVNDGTGQMTLAWSSPEQVASVDAALGDVDGDGDLDLAFTGNEYAPDQLYDNDGTGAFTHVQDLAPYGGAGGRSFEAAWGDWNADGDDELAVVSDLAVAVYDRVAGQLDIVWALDLSDEYATDTAWVDWDVDGDLDLAVLNVHGYGALGRGVHVFVNAGLPAATGDTGGVADTGSTPPTGDTAASTGPTDTSDTGGPGAAIGPSESDSAGCGCGTGGSGGAWLTVLAVLGFTRRTSPLRRRAARGPRGRPRSRRGCT